MKIHSLILRDLIEAEEMIAFIKCRIAAEEAYSFRLLEMKSKTLSNNGFQNQESRVSSVVFLKYKTEMGTIGLGHKQMAEALTKLIKPIERYVEDCRAKMSPRAESIHNGWIKYQKLLQDTITLQSLALKRMQEIKVDETLHLEDPNTNFIKIGTKQMTVDDFNDLITAMQNEIDCEDVWKILGTIKDCYNGDHMLHYLKKKGLTDAEARDILNFLVDQGYIKPISGRSIEFVANSMYQWKRLVLEFHDEPTHKKSKREANRAAFEAVRSAKQLETLRQSLEVSMQEYLALAQTALTEHIQLIKDTLSACLEYEKIPLQYVQTIQDRLSVFLESLDPERELKTIVDRDRTGVRPIPTFVPAQLLPNAPPCIFGVSLEEYTARTNSRIPPILKKCITYLEDAFSLSPAEVSRNPRGHQLDAWLEPNLNLHAIHQLRQLINNGTFGRKELRKYPPEFIVGVIKQYLLELPISVCTDEIYDSIKLLYLSKTEDSAGNRLCSIRNLLATMPTCHFYTLAFLSTYWNGLVLHLSPQDTKVTKFVSLLAPYVLRPKRDTNLTVHDKHPARLVRDLVLNATEVIHPEFLTPSNSNSNLLEDSDIESDEDESSSTRALWDAKVEAKLAKRSSSVTSSIKSYFTRKTGYTITIGSESMDSSSMYGPRSPTEFKEFDESI